MYTKNRWRGKFVYRLCLSVTINKSKLIIDIRELDILPFSFVQIHDRRFFSSIVCICVNIFIRILIYMENECRDLPDFYRSLFNEDTRHTRRALNHWNLCATVYTLCTVSFTFHYGIICHAPVDLLSLGDHKQPSINLNFCAV